MVIRTERYESVHRIDHTSPTKVTPRKRTPYCQIEKYVKLTEMPIVKKKAKKGRKCVHESRYEVAILTGYFSKMTVQRRVALELMLAVSILHPFT